MQSFNHYLLLLFLYLPFIQSHSFPPTHTTLLIHLSHYCDPLPNTTTPHSPRACAKCPPGTSFYAYSNLCVSCPPGLYYDHASDICHPCSPGFYKPHSGVGTCMPCNPGTYAPNPGSSQCYPCPSSTFSDSAADSLAACTTCPPGHFWHHFKALGFPQAQCQRCPPGYFSSHPNARVCNACPPGTHHLRSGHCEPCSPGTFSDTPATVSCALCPAGSYTSVYGAKKCKVCPPKAVAPFNGMKYCFADCAQHAAAKCVVCRSGFGRNSLTSPTCSKCPEGTYSKYETATACIACPPGTVSTPARDECICNAGLVVRPFGPPFCERCPQHAYSLDGVQCVCKNGMVLRGRTCMCISGFKGPDEHGRCAKCSEQESNDPDNSCEVCAPGFGVGPDGACTACGKGYVSTTSGTGTCVKCPDGTESNERNDACVCRPGFGDDGFGCQPCSAGFYSDVNTRSCNACPPGTFSQQGAIRCTPCPPGSRFGTWGNKVCLPKCPVGEVENDHGGCDCGKMNVRRNGKCVPCPFGGVADAMRQKCGCALSHARNGYGGCKTCSEGEFADGWTCRTCEAGTVAKAQSFAGCHFCESGTEAVKAGMGMCEMVCPNGSFRAIPGGPCVKCARGMFVQGGVCKKCPPGSGSRGGDAGACVQCNDGAMIVDGMCENVDEEKRHCGLWEIKDPATGQCTQCPPGMQKTGSDRCEECPAGMAGDGSGLCMPCDKHSSVLSYGARLCDKCPRGATNKESGTECALDRMDFIGEVRY